MKIPKCPCGAVDVLAVDDATHLCLTCAIVGGFRGYCPLTLRWIGDEGCHCPLQKHFDINPHTLVLRVHIICTDRWDDHFPDNGPEARICTDLAKDGWVAQGDGYDYYMLHVGESLKNLEDRVGKTLAVVADEIKAEHPDSPFAFEYSFNLIGIHPRDRIAGYVDRLD